MQYRPVTLERKAQGFLDFSFPPLAPNATRQALEIAGAKNERRLFPVACTRLLGQPLGRGSRQISLYSRWVGVGRKVHASLPLVPLHTPHGLRPATSVISRLQKKTPSASARSR